MEEMTFAHHKARHDLALALLEIGAVPTAASDRPIAIAKPLTPEIVSLAADCMRDLRFYRRLTFDAVVGIPHTGEPIAQAFAELVGVPYLSLEKKIPESIRKVLLVDIQLARPDLALKTIDALLSKDMWVSDVMMLIDYEQDGRRKLTEWGCNLCPVFTPAELLDIYVHAGKIPPALRARIQTYLAVTV